MENEVLPWEKDWSAGASTTPAVSTSASPTGEQPAATPSPVAPATPEVKPWEQNWDEPSGGVQRPPYDPRVEPAFGPRQALPNVLGSEMDGDSTLDRVGKVLKLAVDTNPLLPPWEDISGTVRGFANTAASALKAPGDMAEAVQNYKADQPFEPTWKAPVSSLFVGVKRGVQGLQDRFMPPEEGPPKPWYQNLPENIGGAGAFLFGGELGTMAKLPAWFATGALGAGIGADQQYQDAISRGATPEQAATAFAGGGLFGASMAIPGTYFLDKLNKITGGALASQIKNFGVSGESSVLMDAIKGGLIGAAQSGIQTVGDNWVASDLAGYDPNRTLGENFWSSVATNGVIGSLIGGATGTMRKVQVDKIINGYENQYNEKMNSGDPINFIEGGFTPVQEYVGLRAALGKLDQQMEMSVERGEVEPPIPTDIIPYSDQGPNYTGVSAGSDWDFISGLADKPIEATAEKGIGTKNEDGTTKTVRQALTETPVVAAESNPYKDILDVMNVSIDKKERWIADAKLKVGETYPAVKQQEAVLQSLKNQRILTLAKVDIVKRLVGHAKDYAAAFREAIDPNLKLIITDSAPEGIDAASSNGMFMLTKDYELQPGKPTPVGAIFIDFDNLATELLNSGGKASLEDAKQAKRALFETLNHELGHAIAINRVNKMYQDAQSPDIKVRRQAYDTFKLMTNEYGNWLADAANASGSFLPETQFAPERALSMQGMPDLNKPMGQAFSQPTSMYGTRPQRNYLLSFDEFFAEQTARLAAQGKLADPVMTRYFKPAMEQYQKVFDALPSLAKNEYAGDWLKWLQSQMLTTKLKSMVEDMTTAGGKDIIDAIRGKVPGFDPEKFAGLKDYLDRWNKGLSWGFNLLQLAKEFPHISHWKNYLEAVANWAMYQRNFQSEAVGTVKAWHGLAKEESSKLTDVLFDEALNKRMLTPQELTQRLPVEGIKVYQQIRDQLNRVLEEMRGTALNDIQKTFVDNEVVRDEQIKETNENFDKLKSTGYFPFIRFGKYTVTARAKEELEYNGDSYKKGQLVSFPAFETVKDRDEALLRVRKELGDKANVASGIMRESDFAIQGMPRALLRSLKDTLKLHGHLTEEQAKAIDDAMLETAPFRNFSKHFLKKKGIHGYSDDALRAFAYYIKSAAGHIARVRYGDAMREPILGMQQDVETIKEMGGRSDARQEMRHWMDRHFDYIMNPANELTALRGVGFVSYLGMNVKSAFVNMTQMLTTVYPYLAARYGDFAATKALAKATWTLKDWVSNKNAFIKAKPGSKEANTASLVARGLHEGWLDQSLATELAIASSENNLNRALWLPKAKRFWHEAARYSALPFHVVEKMNRYLTAFATHELEMQKSGDTIKAELAARQANWSANYENARWNRPEFMRGKKSVFFLFQNYLQNTLHFATHDPGATRFFLMMGLLAGMQGLPGADNLEDLIDFAATALNRTLGIKNPRMDLRRELRERLEELHANPDLVLHGVSQNTFGMAHVGELAGIPIPHLDTSQSIGMGRILPGTDIPDKLLTASPSDVLGQEGLGLAGASGNLVQDFYTNLFSNSPDKWKQAEKLMPITAFRNLSKAVRMGVRGGEKTASGDWVAQFDPHDLRDELSLVGQGLGFNPTKLTQGWEREIAQKDAIQYYKVQSQGLMRQYEWAFMQQDREALADVMDKIRLYNKQVPNPEMEITTKAIKQGLRDFMKSQVESGMGIATDRKYRRLRQQVEESYPDPYGKANKEPGFQP